MEAKRIKKKGKLTKAIAAVTVAVLSVASMGLTLSYFTDTDSVTNVFTVGGLDVVLDETWDAEDGKDLHPGDTLVKEPVITASEGDSYMRVILELRDGVTGEIITDNERLDAIKSIIHHDRTGSRIEEGVPYETSDISAWSRGFPSTGGGRPTYSVSTPVNIWSFDYMGTNAEGGLVYGYVVPGAEIELGFYDMDTFIFYEGDTVTVFTHIVIPSDWGSAEMSLLGSFNIVVRVEAIQIEGFTDRDEAFAALDAELA